MSRDILTKAEYDEVPRMKASRSMETLKDDRTMLRAALMGADATLTMVRRLTLPHAHMLDRTDETLRVIRAALKDTD